jgi:hypothetical protein
MYHYAALPLVLLLTGASGCFHDPSTLPAAERAAPTAVVVHDEAGASYALEAAPRRPVLELVLASRAPALPPLLLLEGTYSAHFAANVSAARLQALPAGLIATELAVDERAVHVRPLAPLIAGARYTLLWLDDESSAAFPLQVARRPTLDASALASWPSPGERGVPTNLQRALLVFDGQVHGELAAAMRLEDERGALVEGSVAREPCAILGLAAGECVWLSPRTALRDRAQYALRSTVDLVSGAGGALGSFRAPFSTAAEPDTLAPTLVRSPCAPDEQTHEALCLLADATSVTLRGAVDESALIALVVLTPLASRTVSTLAFAGDFSLSTGPLEGATQALLRLSDLAGNTREQPLTLTPTSDLARISIDEVRSDPLGKEPAQEYVELLNFGTQQVSLMGYSLSTDMFAEGRTIVSAPPLPPGERILVVGPEFDARDERDGALPAALRLARLTRPLPLANAGAALFLRDPSGRRVSSAAVLAPLCEGQCSARRDHELASGSRASFARDPDGRCTPGAPTFDGP